MKQEAESTNQPSPTPQPIQISNTVEGITLREATIKDAGIIYQAIESHREYLKTWLPFVVTLHCVADEEAFLALSLSVPYNDRNIVFIIENNNEFCGLIGFVSTDHSNHKTEIGYWLLPEFQGKGIMTQCVSYLCQWSFEYRHMNRIQIRCGLQNHPSNTIPNRLGFKHEGVERNGELLSSGQYTDLNVYSLLRNEIS